MTDLVQPEKNDAVLTSLKRLVGGGSNQGQSLPMASDRLVLSRANRCDQRNGPLVLSQKQRLADKKPKANPLKRREDLERTIANLEATVMNGGQTRSGDTPVKKPAPSTAQTGPTLVRSAPTPPDEGELRVMIEKCIQDELQGETGAQATRNLRRLVRHEIFSILESEGLLKR